MNTFNIYVYTCNMNIVLNIYYEAFYTYNINKIL